MTVTPLNRDCFNIVLEHLPFNEKKKFICYLKITDLKVAEYLLSLPRNWRLALDLDPIAQKQIQRAAYYSK